VQKGIEMHEIK